MRRLSLTLALLLTAQVSIASAQAVDADLVLRGGTIYDGTGKPGYVGDVAIKGQKIVAVGKFQVAGKPQVFDAAGLAVAPGFIDLHSHSDSGVVAEKTRAVGNFLRQGCTTQVTGNCGLGQVDTPEYFRRIDAQGAGVNVIHLVPHGSLRRKVIGEADRPPTAAELQKMCDLIDEAMRAGAWGMATGLIYSPGNFAKTDELIALSKVVAAHGGIYASHMRNESTKVLDAIEEALTIGREAGVPVHISHFKASGPPAWGLSGKMIQALKAARDAGMTVTADQYPYIASSTGLIPTIVPNWARDGGQKALVARLDDPQTGPRVVEETMRELAFRGGGGRLVISRAAKFPQFIGKNLLECATLANRPLKDVVIDLVRDGAVSIVNFGISEDDMRRITAVDFVATASDGSAMIPNDDKPHPRSYGTFPRKIGAFAHRNKWLSVEQAIRSSSGLPADILRITDRGYLRPGCFADIAVVKLEEFIDHATFENPHQYATGVKRVYLAGQLAVVDDTVTDKLLGRAIRHPSTR